MEISHENRSESSGFSNFLKSFDIYRTLPQDMSEPTYSGAFSKKHLNLTTNFFCIKIHSVICLCCFNDLFRLFRSYSLLLYKCEIRHVYRCSKRQ